MIVAVSVVLAGCMATPSEFTRTALSIDADLASARATIALVHEGRLTIPYARAAFVELRPDIETAPDDLRASRDAPKGTDVDSIAVAVDHARSSVADPCLGETCDWRAQLAAIDFARAALERAVRG